MKLSLSEFNYQVNIAIPYLQANADRLAISQELLTALKDGLAKWNSAYQVATNPATRTSIAIEKMHNVGNSLEKVYHQMQQYVKHLFDVPLNEDDHKFLFIKETKKRGSTPVPIIPPTIDVVSRKLLGVSLQISDPSLPALNHRSLPKDVSNVNIFIAFVNTGESPTDADFHLYKTSGKATFDIAFDKDQIGKVAYISGEFLNSKGEAGPRSLPISVVVSN